MKTVIDGNRGNTFSFDPREATFHTEYKEDMLCVVVPVYGFKKSASLLALRQRLERLHQAYPFDLVILAMDGLNGPSTQRSLQIAMDRHPHVMWDQFLAMNVVGDRATLPNSRLLNSSVRFLQHQGVHRSWILSCGYYTELVTDVEQAAEIFKVATMRTAFTERRGLVPLLTVKQLTQQLQPEDLLSIWRSPELEFARIKTSLKNFFAGHASVDSVRATQLQFFCRRELMLWQQSDLIKMGGFNPASNSVEDIELVTRLLHQGAECSQTVLRYSYDIDQYPASLSGTILNRQVEKTVTMLATLLAEHHFGNERIPFAHTDTPDFDFAQ